MGINKGGRGGNSIRHEYLEYSAKEGTLLHRAKGPNGEPAVGRGEPVSDVWGEVVNFYLSDPMDSTNDFNKEEAPKKLNLVLADEDDGVRTHYHVVVNMSSHAKPDELSYSSMNASLRMLRAALHALMQMPEDSDEMPRGYALMIGAFKAPAVAASGDKPAQKEGTRFWIRGGNYAKAKEVEKAGGKLTEVLNTSYRPMYGFDADGATIDKEPDDFLNYDKRKGESVNVAKVMETLAIGLDEYKRRNDLRFQRQAQQGGTNAPREDDEIPADEASSLAREGQRG